MTMLLPLSLYAEIRMKDGIGEGVTVAKGSDSFSLHGEEWHQVWLDLEHLFKLIRNVECQTMLFWMTPNQHTKSSIQT